VNGDPVTERSVRNPERTRAVIVEAALAEYIEHGSVGLTIGGVARRAGVTPGALASHFVNREGLVNAAVQAAVERIQSDEYNLRNLAALQFSAPPTDPAEIAAFAQFVHKPQSARNRRLVLEGMLLSEHSEALRDFMGPSTSAWIEATAQHVRIAQLTGSVRDDLDPHAIALVWLSIRMGLSAMTASLEADDYAPYLDALIAATEVASHAFDVSNTPQHLGTTD
jgi:TetR/AcrR family transcriptional regulator